MQEEPTTGSTCPEPLRFKAPSWLVALLSAMLCIMRVSRAAKGLNAACMKSSGVRLPPMAACAAAKAAAVDAAAALAAAADGDSEGL
jgi:hypothetical protein